MIEIDFRYVVPHSPEKVFNYLSTFENHAKFLPLTASEQITDGPVRVGTQFRHIANMPGVKELRFEVTEFELNRRLAFRSLTGPFDASITYEFAPQSDGIMFTEKGQAKLKGFLRLLAPIIEPIVRRRFVKDAENLQSVLENLD